jgi:hypothetical protein
VKFIPNALPAQRTPLVTSDGYMTPEWFRGMVAISTNQALLAQLSNLPVYANNAAAITGGLKVGDLYRTGANPDPVCVVH